LLKHLKDDRQVLANLICYFSFRIWVLVM
jgi:hypothetical protein